MVLRTFLARQLDEARSASLSLLEPLEDVDLVRQHSALMSPLAWDLAHVANFEDLWLIRALGANAVGAAYDHLYDAFRNPRADRPSLPLLDPPGARRYLAEVRDRALAGLEEVDFDAGDPLLDAGYVYRLVVQHEHQHNETMVATLQLMEPPGYRPEPTLLAGPKGTPALLPEPTEVVVDGGPFVMGTDADPGAYDNERPAHSVDLPPFAIDTCPTTNAEYLEFVNAGGYREPRWWTTAGWSWRRIAGLEHPEAWVRHGADTWVLNRFGHLIDLPVNEPVQHVCWYEADAYARWRGKRLPTEAEWEKAASWDPVAALKRRYPWGEEPPEPGRANLGRTGFGPSPAGTTPDGASPWACRQMVGDVWEWTSSDFRPYPGFRAFPYPEYSKVFWGSEYKVLRGGSWASHPSAVRTTFRNWDYPIRRQIFAGLRCARDL
ncbi:ergothioneine biosynthesis protein EgtB [soil metagenome]